MRDRSWRAWPWWSSCSWSLWFAFYRLGGIADEAIAIAATNAPSIEHLSLARLDLHRLGSLAFSYVLDAQAKAATPRREVEVARRQVEDDLAAYQAVPGTSAPRPPPDELGPIDDALARLVARAAAHDFDGAVRAYHDLHRAIVDADIAFERLMLDDVAEVQGNVGDIERIRQRTEATTFILGALATNVAAAAGIVAVSMIRRQQRSLERRDLALRARADGLETFAGRIAHDLKNPLAALSLRIGSLQLTTSDPIARTALARIATQIERMDAIIAALLDFARAGGEPAAGAAVDLGDALHASVEALAVDARQAGVTISVAPIADLTVACTPAALANLLHNALRNALGRCEESPGPTRGIHIGASVHGPDVRIEISDTGPSLDDRAIATALDHAVPSAGTQHDELRLYLAIVERIAAAYHGAVRLRSAPGMGLTLELVLPAVR